MQIAEKLRDRAKNHRDNGWETMREGDPGLLEAAADEVERLRDLVADHEEVRDDHKRLVRELDVYLNGEDGAAPQASLCDIVGQLTSSRRKSLTQI